MTVHNVSATAIDGLLVIDLPVHGDARGWFKENWQRAKMVALGLPDFGPVQNNISFNAKAGVTRGIHAEPWEKLVSVATGRVFGAWVDLREGPGFGTVVTLELGPDKAVFIPRGVGNSYQTLEDDTCYSYLVNEHWSQEAKDKYVRRARPPVDQLAHTAQRGNPVRLRPPASSAERGAAVPAPSAAGRGRRRPARPGAGVVAAGRAPRRPCRPRHHRRRRRESFFPWDEVSVDQRRRLTAVDAAEGDGRAACWAVNVQGAANLVAAARRHRLPLVHISTDYVFDGTAAVHGEDEPPSPLGSYGASKAAADALVATLPRHWILRTSWVVGDGPNFVRTMVRLAHVGVSPAVVDDQFGRLTFATDLARAALHLVESSA